VWNYVITTKNPFDDKQLEQTLKRLENEQKLRATEMFWKQRQFFIKKANSNAFKINHLLLLLPNTDDHLEYCIRG
jgi:G3E family GTPase